MNTFLAKFSLQKLPMAQFSNNSVKISLMPLKSLSKRHRFPMPLKESINSQSRDTLQIPYMDQNVFKASSGARVVHARVFPLSSYQTGKKSEVIEKSMPRH